MNRRHFLARGAAATGAILALPSLVKASRNTECTTRVFKGIKTVRDQTYSIRLEFCPEVLESYKTAPKEEKQVFLNISPNENTYYEATYNIGTVKKAADGTATVSCIYASATASGFKLPADFNKLKMTFRLKKNAEGLPLADLLDAKGKTYSLLEIEKSEGGEDGEGCFLTTACIQQEGKGDDCEELQVLRGFRDRYLRQQQDGESLVRAYYRHAPEIVKAIDRADNNREVYAHIYRHMILPTVELVKAGQHEAALDNYASFTRALYENYVG